MSSTKAGRILRMFTTQRCIVSVGRWETEAWRSQSRFITEKLPTMIVHTMLKLQ